MRTSTLALMAVLAASTHAFAQAPPVTSAQDGACRDESRARVFDAPNPSRLSLYELGEQIYGECMKRPPSPVVRQDPTARPASGVQKEQQEPAARQDLTAGPESGIAPEPKKKPKRRQKLKKRRG